MIFAFSGDCPWKNRKPTSKGIEQYVEENSDRIIKEYQDYVGDTLHNVWIYTDDLNDQEDREALELGRFFPHEISHEYVNQVGMEMKSVFHLPVDKSYQTGVWIVQSHTTFGSSFPCGNAHYSGGLAG